MKLPDCHKPLSTIARHGAERLSEITHIPFGHELVLESVRLWPPIWIAGIALFVVALIATWSDK